MPFAMELPAVPTEQRSRERIVCDLGAALGDLMGHYGVPLTEIVFGPPRPGPAQRQVAAVIGFGGEHLGGTMVIQAPRSLIAGCLPSPLLRARGDAAVADWIGELANQLLGRLKSRLVRCGASFMMTPPTHLMGNELEIFSDAPGISWLHAPTADGAVVSVMIDLRLAESFVLGVDTVDEESLDEGEMLVL